GQVVLGPAAVSSKDQPVSGRGSQLAPVQVPSCARTGTCIAAVEGKQPGIKGDIVQEIHLRVIRRRKAAMADPADDLTVVDHQPWARRTGGRIRDGIEGTRTERAIVHNRVVAVVAEPSQRIVVTGRIIAEKG